MYRQCLGAWQREARPGRCSASRLFARIRHELLADPGALGAARFHDFLHAADAGDRLELRGGGERLDGLPRFPEHDVVEDVWLLLVAEELAANKAGRLEGEIVLRAPPLEIGLYVLRLNLLDHVHTN